MIDDPLILGILIASWIFAVVTLVVVLRWVFQKKRRHRDAVSALRRDDDGVMNVPVLATFTGVVGLPSVLAIASNSLNPRLVIHTGAIDYRVTLARNVAFENIASVRVQTGPATTHLVFTFVGGVFTLSANVGIVSVAQSVFEAYPDLAGKLI